LCVAVKLDGRMVDYRSGCSHHVGMVGKKLTSLNRHVGFRTTG
jgi:hypothetical protein